MEMMASLTSDTLRLHILSPLLACVFTLPNVYQFEGGNLGVDLKQM